MDMDTYLYVANGDHTKEVRERIEAFEQKYKRSAEDEGFQSCEYHGDGTTHLIFYNPSFDIVDELTSGGDWTQVDSNEHERN